jgi:tRNA modification GTPase
VTSVAGTTRDVLELALDVGGLPVRVADTAGLRDTPDAVERIGVTRAREAVERADVALCVLAADELRDDPGGHLRDVAPLIGPETLVLVNKTDMVSEPALETVPACAGVFAASVATGAGMPAFVDGLAGAGGGRGATPSGTGCTSSARRSSSTRSSRAVRVLSPIADAGLMWRQMGTIS